MEVLLSKRRTLEDTTNLSSAAQCTLPDPGLYSPMGSTKQVGCAAGTVENTRLKVLSKPACNELNH